MNLEQKEIYLHPELRDKSDNPIADIMKKMVWAVWIIGFLMGICIGSSVGRLTGSGLLGFMIALITWGGAFLLGVFPYAFAEIITLLQHSNRTIYRMEIKDDPAAAYSRESRNDIDNKPGTFEFGINHSDDELPFDIEKINADSISQSQSSGILTIKSKATFANIEAVFVDITLENRVGDPLTLKGVTFTDFKSNGTNPIKRSTKAVLDMAPNMLSNIKSVSVEVKQYSIDGSTYVVGRDQEKTKHIGA